MEIFSYGSCLVLVLLSTGSGAAAGVSNYADDYIHEGNQNNRVRCGCGLIGEYDQNTPERFEDIIDRKLKPLHKDLEETITAKLETISNNLNRKINDLTENVLLELSTNIINKISSKIDSASKENEILESTEKINHRLVVLANDFQNNIVSKLDAIHRLENMQYRTIKEITEILLIEQTTNITREINNKIDLVLKDKQLPVNSIETNMRLAAIDRELHTLGENISSQYHSSDSSDRSVIKSIEEINKKLTSLGSFPKKEDNTQNMTKDGENASPANNTKQAVEIKQTKCGNNTSIFCSPCATLAGVREKLGAAHADYHGPDEQDSLDKYLIDKTGCKYRYLKNFHMESHIIRRAAGSPADSFEWRAAIRARPGAVELRPTWHVSSSDDYGIYIEIGENTRMQEFPSWNILERRRTPGLLSEDRYVPVYYRLRDGVVSFGVECESHPAPLFSRGNTNVVPEQGALGTQWVAAIAAPALGIKYLYDCPAL